MKPTQRKLRFYARMLDAWADQEDDPALRDLARYLSRRITEKVEERRQQLAEKRKSNKEITSCVH